MLLIQHLHVIWTAASRGMPGSAARNAVPQRLPLPVTREALEAIGQQGALVHEICFNESDGFAAKATLKTHPRLDRYWSLSFSPEDEAIKVVFHYSPLQHGKPTRRPASHPVFLLKPGESGLFTINGRFASTSGQWYTNHLVTILHPAANTPLHPDLFMELTPTRQADKCADLY